MMNNNDASSVEPRTHQLLGREDDQGSDYSDLDGNVRSKSVADLD